MAATGTFVLEIGSEEIPSRFLSAEEKNCAALFAEKLGEAHVGYASIAVHSSPRRLAVIVSEIARIQDEQEEIVAGPPKRIAYDAQGSPTKALLGFMRTWGIGEDALFETETEKGVYIAAKRKTGGEKASDLLSSICPSVIAALPFAKKMRWGDYEVSYARPIHWIVALLDCDIVPFTFGPVQSGRTTYGHRIHGPGPWSISSACDYLSCVRNMCQVILDPAERRQVIREEGDRLARDAGGTVLWKEELLDEVVGLVEHPVPLLGRFDPAYLEVPKEVLLTSMEQHQKSFGLADGDGRLLPYFLTVSNTDPVDRDIVRKGWERVLHARLEDARFFWREDCKSSFSAWLDKLDSVIFIEPLGSMGEKTRRLESLCTEIAERLLSCDSATIAAAGRAGRLSKADLVSGMVGEFDTLQGIMGGMYAEKMGEGPLVSAAIAEQYLPSGPESPVPATVVGAILSLADKADTLVGCFGLNRVPTGTADPFALRRCALGILRITKAFSWQISLDDLFAKAQELYGERAWKVEPPVARKRLLEFVGGRLQKLLQSEGFSTVVTEASLRAGMKNIPDVYARITALDHFSTTESYVAHVQVLKRIANILQKRDPADSSPVKRDLLAHESEIALYNHLESLDTLRTTDDYERILSSLGPLQPLVDAFFNSVMVLCEDPNLRTNRLALLASIHSLYARVADFSALQI